ncbi:MAG: hypothetical protein K0Q57_530 [Gammaproteobacteria bacterium]|jgi:glucoamylase|nr:hypothetical protein [Gammaproteobacteria bacterium]
MKKYQHKLSLFILLFLLIPSCLLANNPPFSQNEIATIQTHLFDNIASQNQSISKQTANSMMQSRPGAVIASPSGPSEGFSMDYVLSWVRDSALVMDEVTSLYQQSKSAPERAKLRSYLLNYVNWVGITQGQQPIHPGVSTLGEPIFNINGSIWDGKWSRPQYDGPALQAITLIHINDALTQAKDPKWTQANRDNLTAFIESDLDFVAKHWNQPSYSLWEESMDQNFFTEMVQRKAFIMGAQYETQLGNTKKAAYYQAQVPGLEKLLNKHWNKAEGYYSEGLNQQQYKGGGINISVLLGALIGDAGNVNDQFAPDSDKVLSTAFFTRALFDDLYFINLQNPNAPMLGRYLNDKYDGNQFSYGNPWFIATDALAQYYYTVAAKLATKGKLSITAYNIYFYRQIAPEFNFRPGLTINQADNPQEFEALRQDLIMEGDALLNISKYYSDCYGENDCLHLSEQVDRVNGEQVSAKDLTWSYASILTALQARTLAETWPKQ